MVLTFFDRCAYAYEIWCPIIIMSFRPLKLPVFPANLLSHGHDPSRFPMVHAGLSTAAMGFGIITLEQPGWQSAEWSNGHRNIFDLRYEISCFCVYANFGSVDFYHWLCAGWLPLNNQQAK